MTMRYDLVGRKAILTYLRLSEWRHVIERMRKGLPVIREAEDGRWLACSSDVDAWVEGRFIEKP